MASQETFFTCHLAPTKFLKSELQGEKVSLIARAYFLVFVFEIFGFLFLVLIFILKFTVKILKSNCMKVDGVFKFQNGIFYV